VPFTFRLDNFSLLVTNFHLVAKHRYSRRQARRPCFLR